MHRRSSSALMCAVAVALPRLYLGIADAYAFVGNPGYYGDNVGSFRVTVTSVKRAR